MQGQTYLQRRGAVYQFRRRIPRDITRLLGRGEIRSTLRTHDRRAAERLARERAVELDQEWHAVRQGRGTDRAFGSWSTRAPTVAPPVFRPPAVVPDDGQPVGRKSLSEALAVWARLSHPARSTIEVYRAAIRRFEHHNPGIDLKDISRALLREHVARLQEAGLNPRTVHKEHGALRALLGVAEAEDWIDTNPARGMRLPKIKRKAKRSYTVDEVKAIFSSPVFSKGQRPTAGKGECAFWIPLLMLYTGARREELCQLMVSNVRSTDGIHYLAIDPCDEEGRLKTDESRRAVPIHPELERLGFLKYWGALVKRKEKRLFPQLKKPNKRGAVGAKWGDWWRRYVRETVGLKDPLLSPAHSFRHLFISECRRLRIPDDVQRVFVGHRSRMRDAHDDYGEHHVPALYEEIRRIDFRGYSPNHLYPDSA